jgi:hypothetical protein
LVEDQREPSGVLLTVTNSSRAHVRDLTDLFQSSVHAFVYTTLETDMADDLKNRGAQDRARIALGEEHEVRYWTEALGVTKEELQRAVDQVGNGADAVREFLKK